MILADFVVVWWVGGLLLLGIVGFFVMAVALAVRFIGFVFRSLFGWPNEAPPEAPRGSGRRRVCPHRRCGHLNPPAARYCARCGRPLRAAYDVDAYG